MVSEDSYKDLHLTEEMKARVRKQCVWLMENYEKIDAYESDGVTRKVLGNCAEHVCRFCGAHDIKTHPDDPTARTFKKKAHALSNLIGNRTLFSSYECDECNGVRFTRMESHFANFMKLYHCVSGVRGKRGPVSYKYSDETKSRIDNNERIDIKSYVGEEPIAVIDEATNLVTIQGRASYVPREVYRCLLKMALTVMPESEMKNMSLTLDLLMNKIDVSSGLMINMRIFKSKFAQPGYMIYRRRTNAPSKCPAYVFLLYYGTFAFQLHLPLCDLDKALDGTDVKILPLPVPCELFNNPVVNKWLDLTSVDKLKDELVTITLKYESMSSTDFSTDAN